MTYVVDERCIKCKTTDCVAVCPVNCFYEGESMLVIHPDECIDCGVCVPECPVDAIKPDTEPGLEMWLELNREYAQKWPTSRPKRTCPRTHAPTGTRPGNSTSTFRPSRVRATEQVYSGRYPMTAHRKQRTNSMGGYEVGNRPISEVIDPLPSYHPEIATDKGADLIVAGARGRILDLLPDRGLNFVFEAAQAARARELVYVDDDEPGHDKPARGS